MGRVSYEPSVNHFSHPHPLHLISLDQSLTPSICAGCASSASGTAYSCRPCGYVLHVSCSQSPPLIRHPFDTLHPLTLLSVPAYPEGSFNCDACGCDGTGFSYHCDGCGLDLHALCASKPLSVHNRAHLHPLCLLFSPPYSNKGFSCDICGSTGSNHWLYRCAMCEFDAHLECATAAQTQQQQQYSPARVGVGSTGWQGGTAIGFPQDLNRPASAASASWHGNPSAVSTGGASWHRNPSTTAPIGRSSSAGNAWAGRRNNHANNEQVDQNSMQDIMGGSGGDGSGGNGGGGGDGAGSGDNGGDGSDGNGGNSGGGGDGSGGLGGGGGNDNGSGGGGLGSNGGYDNSNGGSGGGGLGSGSGSNNGSGSSGGGGFGDSGGYDVGNGSGLVGVDGYNAGSGSGMGGVAGYDAGSGFGSVPGYGAGGGFGSVPGYDAGGGSSFGGSYDADSVGGFAGVAGYDAGGGSDFMGSGGFYDGSGGGGDF